MQLHKLLENTVLEHTSHSTRATLRDDPIYMCQVQSITIILDMTLSLANGWLKISKSPE